MGGLNHTSPLACIEGHTTTFIVNAALLVSPWQYHTWTISLHSLINANLALAIVPKHKAGQATSALFQDFGLTGSGREPSLTDLVVHTT